MRQFTIRLNVKEFLKASIDKDIKDDTQLAKELGVSRTQIYRVKLNPEDPNYNAPGTNFIIGVLKLFDGPFERFFFLDEVMRGQSNNKKVV